MDPLSLMAIIGGGSSLLSGLLGSTAATQASQAQAQAAQYAANLQNQMFQTGASQITPYAGLGMGAGGNLAALLGVGGGPSALSGSPTAGTNWSAFLPKSTISAGPSTFAAPQGSTFSPTMDFLSQFPGYQFALDQGLKATTNAFTAQGQGGTSSPTAMVPGAGGPSNMAGGAPGLGPSGNLGKGLANYAEGLASTTEQQAYNQWLATNQNAYQQWLQGNMGAFNQGQAIGNLGLAANQQQFGQWFSPLQQQLASTLGLTQLGAGAAGSLMGGANTAGANIGQSIMGLGNAQAAGTIGSTAALTGALGGASGAAQQYALLSMLGLGGKSMGSLPGVTGIAGSMPVPTAA